MCSGLSSAHGLENEVCSCVVRFLRLMRALGTRLVAT